MKTKVLIFSLVLLFGAGLNANLFAQKSEISFDFGAGNTTVSNSFEVVYPFERYYDAFYRIGARHVYTTANGMISLYTGFTLDKKVLRSDQSEYYLKIPFGFQLNYGEEFKFHIGAGLNQGTYLGNLYKRFTLGAFFNAGPSYRLTESYRLMLSYQANADITPMAVEQGSSQAGQAPGPDYKVRGYDGFLLLSLYLKL